MNSPLQPPSVPTRDELIVALAERDRELAQALERQTATAEILKVIASSPTDVQPVFQAIADNAKRVLGGRSAFVARYVADMAHLAAYTSTDPETDAVARASWPRPMVGNPIVEAVQNGRIFQVADIETVPDSGLFRTAARQGWRSALTAPLATKGMTIGSITVTRSEPGVFAEDDVQLMRTFADQAVIAIENTRLFNETKEALERQTATADVLGAIGRSVSDAAPVFEEILNACQRLFGSEEMGIYTVGADEMVRVAAWRGPRALEVSKDVSPLADSITGKMIRERRTHHIPDLREEPNLSPMVRERAERLGSASLLYAPMLREDRGLGSILVVRAPPRPFTERETELLRTFADQAAIAIENARLFNETQEALERQTATAEILKVIASSPTDVQPVFQAIADSAKRLLAGHSALVTRYMDGLSHIAAFTPISPEADAALAASYPRPLKGNPTYEAVRDGFPFKLPDVEEADPEGMRKQARGRGWRSLTALPLLNRGAVIGAIAVTRAAPGALADEDIQLLRTFADQAEIAIENTRLFNETQEALNQQTATADVLKVISRSVFDLDTVLQTLIDTAVRLTRGSRGTIFLRQDDVLVARAFHSNVPGELRAYLAATTWRLDGDSHMARAARERVVVHVADLSQSQIESDKQVQKRASFGAGLWTPLMREGEVIGVFGVPRDEPIAFTDREIELIQTFADQAVIAIENSRLFEQVQAKTRDLQAAFERQKATADILRVISASPTDVTPVFAAIVETAVRLIGCYSAMVFRVEGDKLAPVTGAGRSGPLDELSPPVPIDPENNFPSRAVVSKETYHVPDYSAIELSEFERQIQDVIAPPSALFLPFVREGECIGLMALAGDRPHAFGAEDIALAESFRDQALIAIENARLFNETQESLQQQTATADVLKVISRSAFDLDAVLDTLVSSAGKLCGADGGIIWLRQGEKLHAGATFGYSPEATGFFKANPRGLGDKSLAPRVMRSGRTEHIPDRSRDPDFSFPGLAMPDSMLGVPLFRGVGIEGVFTLSRVRASAFSPRQIELVETFADQAVIAIENARLFDEVQARTRDLEESLAQQTATADVLKAISRSAFDLQPVLDTLVRSAVTLCEADGAMIYQKRGDAFYGKSFADYSEEFIGLLKEQPQQPGHGTVGARVLLTRQVQNLADLQVDPQYDRQVASLTRHRAILGVPLLRDEAIVGAIVVGRAKPGAFTQRQIDVVQTFADQAVIAIENARLFEEVQAKTRDLEESLAQQTATADVLKTISRSVFELDVVLAAVTESARKLCGADQAAVHMRDGRVMRFSAGAGMSSEFARFNRNHPIDLDQSWAPRNHIGFATLSGQLVMIPDVHEAVGFDLARVGEIGDLRGLLAVPMLREGEVEGVFSLCRSRPGEFGPRQVDIVRTFSDQAVIAIENARLFEEVQARTRDLSEALQQQTATSEVLKVISRSAFDLQAVFNTLVTSAVELGGAMTGTICVRDGDVYRYRDTVGAEHTSKLALYLREHPAVPGRSTMAGRVLLSGKVERIPDCLADPEYVVPMGALASNVRSLLGVPLLRKDGIEGAIILTRAEPGEFTERQIEIVQTFADQAVIALENVRLFEEVQARTREVTEALQQQTATADVLKVISRSAFDLQAVFDTLTASAVDLCSAFSGSICVRDGDIYRYRGNAGPGVSAAASRYLADHPAAPGRGSIVGRVLLSGKVETIPDIFDDAEYVVPLSTHGQVSRSLLGVPLLAKERIEGALVLTRGEPGHFTNRQIEIVQTFADQAVIALENVRLFDEVQARTRELAASLDDLRKAQDRLIQSEKLASLGQLTAGIAHEIKNPLNFVNNFSGLSRELLDELRELLAKAKLAEPEREQADELIGLVASNLDKVVTHGKRADSIVKNMLLHSREGSGERTSVNVNTMVEEALNLAYHGARAEKPGFNVTIEKSLDPAAGAADLYPQEITRVLLNLISNGFYATTKRKQSNANGGYEPTVSASTRNLGDRVAIVITDNGTGIAEEVKAKMFNPFFTTKPAGEGTGLGLSLSHDIVVKQHGGTLEVTTEPGSFTEFTIVLPRGPAPLNPRSR